MLKGIVVQGERGNFLENMIDVKLQLQEARRLDISSANEEIADAIENIKKKYNMSEKDFVESLKKRTIRWLNTGNGSRSR